ncbi:hypothetical protein JZX86_14940 [Agrobacterium rosae]|nr:hypothetical protein [Agrobacterium rosae]MBN7806649.1 hypothetical protein [Agrobacterium rosae]
MRDIVERSTFDVMAIRNLAVTTGTVGGRMARISKPSARMRCNPHGPAIIADQHRQDL